MEQSFSAPGMLHITDGESVAGTLRDANIPGKISVYGDLLYEGPAPAGLTDDAWRSARVRFIAAAGYAPLEEAQQYLESCSEAVAAYPAFVEVVIWMDHRLSNQLILIKLLDWLSREDLGRVKLSLICAGDYPGMDQFVGLGQLNADQLASLADTRLQVENAQLRLARAAWAAFTSPDPTAIEQIVTTDTCALPFLVKALHRHLEQFPSVLNGLSRTEQQALLILRDRGPMEGRRLFAAVQRMEEQIFMGDLSFYRMMKELSVGRRPLVQVSDAILAGLGVITITAAGSDVIVGRADQIELNGIDRWLGGVHLKDARTAWRWDGVQGKLVR